MTLIISVSSFRSHRRGSEANSKAELLLLDPGKYTCKDQHARHKYSPKAYMEHPLVEASLRSCTDCRQRHQQNQIAAHPMILVQHLPVLNTAQNRLWYIELCEANQGLDDDQDECHQAHDTVNAREPGFWMAGFIHLDDDQTGDERQCSGEIQYEMDMSSFCLLFRGCCWLKDKNCLGEKQNARRVNKLVDRQPCKTKWTLAQILDGMRRR
jgi:hypothetical protein